MSLFTFASEDRVSGEVLWSVSIFLADFEPDFWHRHFWGLKIQPHYMSNYQNNEMFVALSESYVRLASSANDWNCNCCQCSDWQMFPFWSVLPMWSSESYGYHWSWLLTDELCCPWSLESRLYNWTRFGSRVCSWQLRTIVLVDVEPTFCTIKIIIAEKNWNV